MKDIVIERIFDAPVEVVYKAWTDPEALGQWWGPPGASIEVHKFDFTPGGIFHYSMSMGPQELYAKFTYEEIVPNEKIVFINSFSDENGGMGSNPWLAVWPKEIRNVLTFEDNGGKTTITLTGHPINASEEELAAYESEAPGMENGFEGTFRKLDDYLAQQAKEQ
jgi:uncharacterized protein YndB with AHSA1/START domain